MGGRVGRYALWQLRDFFMGKGAVFVIFAGVFGVAAHASLNMNGAGWKHAPNAELMSRLGIAGPITFLSFFGIVIVCSSLVSGDRMQGYFRFLFAKPVNLVQYYVQLWLLTGVCVIALAVALTWLWGVIEAPVAIGRIAATFAVSYVVVGGLSFLLSTLMRFDWLMTLVLWTLAQVAGTVFSDRPAIKAIVGALLPPSEHYTAVRQALASATAPVPATDLAWVLGYGVACLIIGLVILRKRPMAS
jgi:hypothetical protein